MLDTSRILLKALATDLAAGISPARWDLSVDDVLRAMARVTGDRELGAARTPVSIFLDGTSSGAGLDLAYGSPDAAGGFREMCARLIEEVEGEREWFASNPDTWARSLAELGEVLAEFDHLTSALRRIAAATVDRR